MTYLFNCNNCGKIEIKCSHKEVKEIMNCPTCNSEAKRIYTGLVDIWKCGGNCGRNK